jgi:hypothetical protein
MVVDFPFTVTTAVLRRAELLGDAVGLLGAFVGVVLLLELGEVELPQATTARAIKRRLMPSTIRLRSRICHIVLSFILEFRLNSSEARWEGE